MEPSKEAINVRLCRLAQQLWGRGELSLESNYSGRRLTRETILDALTSLYDECNKDALIKNDVHISNFIEKYRSIIYELKQLRINLFDFEVKDLIGRGHFGEVNVVKEKHTGDIFAMKTLKKDTTLRHINIAFFEEERDIMALSKSKWLVRLQYAFQDASHLYLIMEYCSGGDLAGLLERTGKPLPEKDAVFYIAEIIQGLNDLHKLGFVHRDIKPDNVLLDRCGHLKLGDFGSASRVSSSGKIKSSMPIGTTEYISPEILMGLENPDNKILHSTSCDYWSLGIVAYELVTCSTPFKTDKSAVQTYKNIMDHANKIHAITIKYPKLEDSLISDDFKKFVNDLLHPVPEKRPNYENSKRNKLFKNISWNNLREQAPPFVPIINSQDDTSNFLEVEKQKPALNSDSFKTKNTFTGKNLPFIGFTYTGDIKVSFDNVEKNDKKDSGCNSSSESTNSNGFLNNSINGTAICVSSVREMENLLESRKKEIESLHKKLASLSSKQTFSNEKEKKLDETEKQRFQLEKDLADMLCQNQKLQHQLDMEHKGRQILENKSLQLIRSAKERWKEKTEKQIAALNEIIHQYESNQADSNEKMFVLESELAKSKSEISNYIDELEKFKKMQLTHKDNMAKARRLSRQSIIGIEQISQETNMQLQTLTQNLRREIELKNKLDKELKECERKLNLAEENEINLKSLLQNEKHMYTAELMVLSSKYDEKCQEVSELLYRVSELEDNKRRLEADHNSFIEKEKKESNNKTTLHSKIAHLENKINDLEKSECSLKSMCKEKNIKYDNLYKDKLNLEVALKDATKCEEKHRERVAALEDMLFKLQREVDELSSVKLESTMSQLQNTTVSTQANNDLEKIANLEEKVNKLQEQLKTSSDEMSVVKKEARKADLALWKKEKELENSNLDLRIATKDLKKAEEKIASLQTELENKITSEESKLKDIQKCLNEKLIKIKDMEKEIEILNKTISDYQNQIKTLEKSTENESKRSALAQQKMKMEIQCLTEKNESLHSELKTSEERRLKAENIMESSRREFKEVASEKCTEKEQRIRLEVMYNERSKEYEALLQNYKMLQETCTILEEQLMDFENVTEALDKNNLKLKEELASLQAEIHNSNVETSKMQKLLDIQKFSTITAEVKLKENVQKLEDDQTKIAELEKQVSDLLSRESQLTGDLNRKNMEITQLQLDLKQSLSDIQHRQSEIIALKEECTRLLTDGADFREDNMQIQLELKELKEKNTALHNLIKEQEEEMSARQFHWQQRELKAEATISQQIKLIDFLQMKVEENKRKKTFGDMLFGKSSTKENVFPPLTPQTPLNRKSSGISEHSKDLLKEKQKNRELQEQLEILQSKLKKHEGKTETKVEESYQKINSDEKLMDGWVKMQKGAVLVRINLKLFKDHLEWKGEKEGLEGKIDFEKNSAQLNTELTPKDLDVHLSEYEMKSGFKINSISSTTCWPSQSLLVICSSTSQKEMWLSAFQKSNINNKQCEINIQVSHQKPKSIVQFSRNLMEPNCVLEIEKNLLLIGSNTGLHCFSMSESKKLPVAIAGIQSITKARIIPSVDQIVMLFQSGKLMHYSLCQLTAVLKSAAYSSIQPSVIPVFKNITINNLKDNSDDDKNFDMFEVSRSKQNNDKIMLCASTSTNLTIFSYDLIKMTFVPLRTLKTDTISCMKFTQHTVIVASHKFYEIDLKNFKVEEFLDPSDLSLSHAIFAHKKNVFPIAIIQTKDISVEKCYEYLLCYSSFGIFVDEFGQRSRTEDIKWSHLPINIVFRKPFIYVIHFSSVEIIHLTDDSFQKPSESDTDSIKSSCITKSFDNPSRVIIDVNTARYLGKSMANSSIFVMSTIPKTDLIDIMELNGKFLIKTQFGESVETLDTIDDNDSCKSLKIAQEDNISAEGDYTLSEDSSVDIKTDFAAHIREKARVINSLKRENDKLDKINGMLSGKNRNSPDSSSSGEESDVSSSYGDAKTYRDSAKNKNGSNIYMSMNKNNPTTSQIGSLPPSTTSIVNDMFLKKQVRFDK